jgi:hypothetical protein
MIAYGCCVGSWDKFQQHVLPRVDGPTVALSGQTSICAAYNAILDAHRPRRPDAVVLLHDDLEITDPDFEAKVLAAVAEPDVALVGVCGGRGRSTLSWWESPCIGHQMTDSGLIDFDADAPGPREGDVAFIEGSLMVFSPWAVENLRFDLRYPAFLGYDDVCLTALDKGRRVVVRTIDTHHHSTIGFKSEAIRDMWDEAEAIFQRKWHR